MGRAWGPLSLRQRAGVALAVWAIAFEILAVAAAIPGGPTASLAVDDPSPIVGQTVHFDASASVGHDQGLGRIVTYRFDFGDGAGTPDQVLPTSMHAYSEVGPRRASVTAVDARGNQGTATATIDVRARPSPTGPEPDLTPAAAAANPARPIEGQVVGLAITIMNRGGAAAESATVDVYDARPNGTTVAIGQTVMREPLAAGASVVMYSESFLAVGVGNHTLRIVVGNVTPSETYQGDNVLAIRMTVVPRTGPPPPDNGFPLGTAVLVIGLGVAGVAALVGAALLLRNPRGPGPLEPPPAEPPDQSPPPMWPP